MIGSRVKENRKARGFTLNELASASGLTASYISQVERNLTEPSIASLRKIAGALKLPMYTFLDDEDKETFIIRADKRKKLLLPNSSVVYEFLSPTGATISETPKLEVVMIRLDPKSWSREDFARHTAEECLVVIEGVLLLDCEEESYHLYEGDSAYIRNNIPHKIYNPGNTPAISISCFTPPTH